jgi:hypothetical protein
MKSLADAYTHATMHGSVIATLAMAVSGVGVAQRGGQAFREENPRCIRISLYN